MQTITTNPIEAFATATILGKCLHHGINPHQLREIQTEEPIDLVNLIHKATTQLLRPEGHHYLALYLNRDEPTITIEPANSREELNNLFPDPYEVENPLEGLIATDTMELNGITYTIETIEDI